MEGLTDSKVKFLMYLAKQENPYLILVQETWLKPLKTDDQVGIPGYIFRKDRPSGDHGSPLVRHRAHEVPGPADRRHHRPPPGGDRRRGEGGRPNLGPIGSRRERALRRPFLLPETYPASF